MISVTTSTTTTTLSNAPHIPSDPVFDLTKNYLLDKDPSKINVGQGTYRDEFGDPWILPSVRMAKDIVSATNHEYLPIAGLKEFRDLAVKLVFNEQPALREQRIASCQSVSGTGALLLTGLMLRKLPNCPQRVYITDPTWSNHELLFHSLGFEVLKLPYYHDGEFAFSTYMEALQDVPTGSAVVLHACAHNPTGCDPTKDQWKAIAELFQDKGLFPIIDAAYLGFNSGSVREDAWMIKYSTEDAHMEAAVCMSFAKSMGLYGERVGLAAVVANTPQEAINIQSLLENVQRATVSNPPAYGAKIAAAVLGNSIILEQWEKDLVEMSTRIKSTREKLYNLLAKLQTPGNWTHITKQTGMFGYLGLSPVQVALLQKNCHIYMTTTARISIAGLNGGNLDHFARSVDWVVRQSA